MASTPARVDTFDDPSVLESVPSVLESTTRAAAVTKELRRLIVSGELPPGTRLRQVEVAERFAVSTTPVREAFTALAREGLLHQDDHRGVHVFRPTARDVRDNYEIRLALEPLATELAAKVIDESTLEELERLIDEMDDVFDFKLGTDLNRRFHFEIYRVADRPLLLALIERLRHAADAYAQLLASQVSGSPAYRDAVMAEHRNIVAALRARAPRRAHKAMSDHLRHNLDQITALIDSEG